MSAYHTVRARVRLYGEGEGGLEATLPSGTPSLALFIPGVNAETGERLYFGAEITTDANEALQPGADSVQARLGFWMGDAARPYFSTGTRFKLWHGREVGEGQVVQETVC